MPEGWYILAGILVAAAVTWTLRAAPFAALAPLRKSDLLDYLGEHMPVGIMFILTVYTLKDTDVTSLGSAGPALVGLVVTVVLHLCWSKMIVSIFGGTAAYVILASTLI